jgi:hypothetical protein
VLFGPLNPFVTRYSSSLMISESLRLLGLQMSNPCVTCDNSSLIISESKGVVWAVESMRQP